MHRLICCTCWNLVGVMHWMAYGILHRCDLDHMIKTVNTQIEN